MQFTIEVLPAPVGPMFEKQLALVDGESSTSVSARTPPNRQRNPLHLQCGGHSILPDSALGALFIYDPLVGLLTRLRSYIGGRRKPFDK